MYHYLFDTNVYRSLVSSEGGVAFKRLIQSLSNIPILDEISSSEFVYGLSPFTFLEAIGSVIPRFDFKIPKQLLEEEKVPELVRHVLSAGFAFYASCESLKRPALMKRALEQQRFNQSNNYAREFEQLCVYNPLKYEAFEQSLHKTLAFDFLCKQPYPKQIVIPLLRYLMGSNFYHNPLLTISKFRLLTLHWRFVEDQYNREGYFSLKRMESFRKSMSLKTTGDTLDCELVHLACIGKYIQEEFQPVLAFTMDDKQIITDRILAYRSLSHAFSQTVKDEFQQLSIYHMWREGVVAFCNKDGAVYDYLIVRDLPKY